MEKSYNHEIIDQYHYFLNDFDKEYQKYNAAVPGTEYESLENSLKNFFFNSRDHITIHDATKAHFFNNYICMLLEENTFSQESDKRIVELYLKVLKEALEKEPFLYFSLPISNLPPNVLDEYLPMASDIEQQLEDTIGQSDEIYNKLINNEKITDEEIELLIRLVSNFIENKQLLFPEINMIGEKIVSYLINNEKNYTYQEKKFILKYLALEECQKHGIDDLLLIFTDDMDGKTAGEYDPRRKTITINQAFLETQSMSSLITHGVHTIFHEIAHHRQRKAKEKHLKNDLAFMQSSANILRSLDKNDYTRNYWAYEVERNAELEASLSQMDLKDKYNIQDNIISTTITASTLQTAAYSALTVRKDENDNLHLSSYDINKKLDFFFKDNASAFLLYPEFLQFYHLNGSHKDITELLMQSYDNCDEFMLGQFITRAIDGETIDKDRVKNASIEEQISIAQNYLIIIKTCYKKIKNMNYVKMIKQMDNYMENLLIKYLPTTKKDAEKVLDQAIEINLKCYYQTILAVRKALMKHMKRCQLVNNKAIEEINNIFSSINSIETVQDFFNEEIEPIEISETIGVK